ncbi:MAG: hypothetical protein ACLRT5_14600 [Lachnospiraceae bacterium]
MVVDYICDEESDWNPDLDDIRKKTTGPHQSHRHHLNESHGSVAVSREILGGDCPALLEHERDHPLTTDDRLVMDG